MNATPSSHERSSLDVFGAGACQPVQAHASSTVRIVGHRVSSTLLLATLASCAGEKSVNSEPPVSPVTATPESASSPAATAAEAGPSCGRVVCAPGTECCNASCGLCVPPGTPCTTLPCNGDTQPPAPGAGVSPSALQRSCADVRCAAGTYCALIHVPCPQAACNPVPECVPGAAGTARQPSPQGI